MINLCAIFRLFAVLLGIVSLFMLLPMVTALFYYEHEALVAFGQTFGLLLGTALCIRLLVGKRREDEIMSTKSGLIFVSFCWLIISFFGGIPYYLVGDTSLADAFFESASGFTSTGATIYSQLEHLPKSILLWRGVTNWLGGMGVVVLTVALMPFLSIGGVRLVKAESTGQDPTRLSSQMTKTAKHLWFIYLGLTLLEFILLKIFGMSAFEAACYALASLSTGGFAPRTDSVISLPVSIQIIITVFMFLGGVNFSLYFWLLRGHYKTFFMDSEFRAYTVIVLGLSLASAITLWACGTYQSFLLALHHCSFQICSLLTTTGFVITNYELWPSFAFVFIVLAMLCGGCIGSTAGGFKIARIVVFVKQALTNIKSTIYPNGFFRTRINGRFITNFQLAYIAGFLACYILLLFFFTLVVASARVPFTDSLLTSLSALGNIGPGYGITGPMYSFATLPSYVKIALSFAMIIGRLEFFTSLSVFIPLFWKKWGD